MANTNELKKVVEPGLLRAFWLSRAAQAVPLSGGLRRLVHEMEPDGIGIHPASGTLFMCEATASGYMGGKRGDFHDGAATKLIETYARFSLLMHSKTREELLATASKEHACSLTQLRCHLIVPQGTRFIQALGYRTRFLKVGVMELTQVELSPPEQQVMEIVLREARGEMQ
ncbi:hypothetical protein [Stigmatella hybrida]|uniref:hypothetical protein n=1 Tax=Stigmatella hybrida TaxID=394097 RepID=UPI001CDACBD1|nr:hypothetical protein [Stigmatella hybrida]